MVKSLENVLKKFGESMNEEDRSNLKQLLRKLKIENLLSGEFRFRCIWDKSIIYTAKLKGDLYVVSWIEDGKKETVTYSIGRVRNCIEEGIWILEEME